MKPTNLQNYKTTFFVPLTILLLLLACKKEINSPIDNLSPLTKEVLAKTSLLELKQGQSLLSYEEREILWKTKLDFILSNKNENFTSDQRKIVVMLKEFLDKTGIKKMAQTHSISAEFMNSYLPYFEKHFSKEQLNILIESPYFKQNMLISTFTEKDMQALESPTSQTMRVAAVAHCTCNYDLGCSGAGNDCAVKGCTTDSDLESCGLFGMEDCKKRCEGIQPDLD